MDDSSVSAEPLQGAQEGEKQLKATGIQTFDAVLQGGIPENHTVLLAGDSGTGKTLLSMEWLFAAADEGEKGLYLTLTESVTEAVENIADMQFYQEKDQDAVKFVDLRTTLNILDVEENVSQKDAQELIDAIVQVTRNTEASRVVIDSVTALGYLMEDQSTIRSFIFRLNNALNEHGVTTILTSEVSGDGYSVFGTEEFISDGIIKLEQTWKAEQNRRRMKVVKMRGREYHADIVPFHITDQGVRPIFYDADLDYDVPDDRTSIGVEGIDAMFDGGVCPETFTLVSGPSGTGKTMTAIHFIREGIEDDRECLYVSFEDSEAKIRRQARNVDMPLDDDNAHFYVARAEDHRPAVLLERIIERIDRYDVDRVVIDSLSALDNVIEDETFTLFTRKLTPLLKKRGVTMLGIIAQPTMTRVDSLTDRDISTLADNAILYKYAEKDGRLVRSIAIISSVGPHEEMLREYTITGTGIEIGQALTGYAGVLEGTVQKIGEAAEDRIREAFIDTLGDEGEDVFNDLRKDVLTEKRIQRAIDGLIDNGALSTEKGEQLRGRCIAIINDENDTVCIDQSTVLTRSGQPPVPVRCTSKSTKNPPVPLSNSESKTSLRRSRVVL
jgi:circadian clock protein KaiC